jgi:diguanylate cyclase (GGDEF)-like protein/hemerythrin-like metal-binding protein/PAS domain S-box-containing protein
LKKKSINSLKLIAILCWLLILTFSAFWFEMNSRWDEKQRAFSTSRAFFQEVMISRSWNASHGGVYVPITSKTLPNKYLPLQNRDLTTDKGLKLTKINPAYMTRQIAELAKKNNNNIQFHITSLNPIRPENKATDLETRWLKSFKHGVKEQGGFFRSGNINWFRYMAPLFVKKECLQCHAKQGYKEGDIRGGLSISIPYSPHSHLHNIVNHSIVTVLGLIFILIGVNLYEQKKRLFDATFNSPMPVCVTDTNYTILVANESYWNTFGSLPENQESIKCYDHRPGNLCHTEHCTLNRTMERMITFTHECSKEVNGVIKHFIITSKPIFNSKGKITGCVGSYQNITNRKKIEEELKEANQQLETLSITDGLTGIANRRQFDKLLEQEYSRHARSGAELSLIMLDIDFFKLFNDCYGHVDGDKCLQEVAKVIANRVARKVDLAARYGGEEFVCILPETCSNDATTIAEWIQQDMKSLAIPHKESKVADYVTASFGVLTAKCPVDGSAIDLVIQVDELLYKAKASGRDQIKIAAPVYAVEKFKGNVAQFVWQDSYCCGNLLIDSQHQSIFNLANELFDAILSHQSKEQVSTIAVNLLETAKQHFYDEEKLLRSLNFPQIDQHISDHKRLLKEGHKMARKFSKSKIALGEVFEFIASEGIIDHMLKVDLEFFSLVDEDLTKPSLTEK